MKAKKYWILAVLVAGIFAVNCWGTSESESDRKSLVGLEGVWVLVENLDPVAEKYGLTRRTLQTDVELRLRQNGIRVLSRMESFEIPGGQHLYINVNVLKHTELPIAAVNVDISLRQDVLLRRNPNILCRGVSTWEVSQIGLFRTGRLKEKGREGIKDTVDEFINDYLAANPKKKDKPKDEQKQ